MCVSEKTVTAWLIQYIERAMCVSEKTVTAWLILYIERAMCVSKKTVTVMLILYIERAMSVSKKTARYNRKHSILPACKSGYFTSDASMYCITFPMYHITFPNCGIPSILHKTAGSAVPSYK
jgi:hypothetical protein